MTVLLELDRVSKSFGSVRVIQELGFALSEGEALGVVGPNGAGKTTMMDLIAGVGRVDEGEIVFGGEPVTRVPTHVRCRMGIARTFQIPQPFEALTVFENVLVGARFGRPAATDDRTGSVFAILETIGLAGDANRAAGSLNLLQRKRLELGRALATGPRLLLLDEIGGGLTEGEVGELVETIRRLRAGGLTIVWIEHIVHALTAVVDRLIAIDFGRKLADGPPRTVMASPEVQAVYMGVEA